LAFVVVIHIQTLFFMTIYIKRFASTLLCCFFMLSAVAQNSMPASSPTPALNKQIVAFVDKHMGKKIGRGECWDLAKYSLNEAGAKWDKAFKYGKPIDPKKDEVFPGDFIQFENVKVQFEKDGGIHTETMTQHTAVVYKVNAPGVYVIAHQNNAFSGRKMGTSELDLATVKRGKLKFYRPTN
jgi:hypothetical protein